MSKAGPSRIPLARPSIGDAERSAAQRVLSGTQLTGGPELSRFEGLLAQRSGREHAVAVSSGTAALELSLWALGISQGDEVLVSAFGFPAAANAIAARGAVPIPIDVRPDTWCIDSSKARQAVNSRTKAVVTIDQLGVVTSSEEIAALETDTGLPVLSDAACGLAGHDAHGRPAGSTGRVATFSFHPRKLITTGEGGAIVCDDPVLARSLRELRNHGQVGGGVFSRIGTNARLAELPSAIGCAQMARLEPMLAERRMLVAGYKERLQSLQQRGLLSWQEPEEGALPSWQSFSVLLHDAKTRPSLFEKLSALGIESGVATYSFPQLSTFASTSACPMASRLHAGGVSLPLYIGMRSVQLNRVCEGMESALR